jgi:penicillin amidase
LVDGDALARIGDAGYALGARARQIRDALHARATWSPSDMLALQLDDRALFLERWRGLFLAALPLDLRAAAPRRARAAALVEDWGGHAAVGSAGYRIVRAFRDLLADEILSAVAAPCAARDPDFRTWWIGPQREYAAWSLLRERPAHLLPPRHRSWDACILAAVDSTIVQLQRTGPDLAARTWGERNRARIRHPLSLAVPALGRWLDMPRTPLPGDAHMPRVQSPAAGASQRFVVSPGDEAAGIFHMPGGQSGHPWSPHYRDGHAAWESGAAEPFLPGAAVDTLRLLPAP